MKALFCLMLTFCSVSALADTPVHISLIPVKADKDALVSEITSNLKASIATMTFYNCKSVSIDTVKFETYRNGEVVGTLSALVGDCEHPLDIDYFAGFYDKNADKAGRFFNLSLDLIKDGKDINQRAWNFKQDLHR